MNPTTIKMISDDRLTIYGDLDFHCAPELAKMGHTLIDQAPDQFYIDLHHVKRVCSVSLALLLNWLRYAHRQKKQVIFINTPQKLAEIARVSGFVIGINGISTLENH